MLIFDEKKYAQSILEHHKYNTKKNQGRERGALVRYLFSLDYDNKKIKDTLHSIPMFNGDYLEYEHLDLIYDKIIHKAGDFDFITNINVGITQKELDVILQYNNIYYRNLLFVYLVYYKWAIQVSHLHFFSKNNNIEMVVENDKDLWKIAGLSKLRVKDRYVICNKFVNDGLYKQDNFKRHNYYYLTFIDNGESIFYIKNYDNIVGELDYYLDNRKNMRCQRCDVVVKKTTNNRKYCVNCAKIINIEKTLKNKKV